MKYALIYHGIKASEIENKLFKDYNSQDTVSIYQLSRILMRIIRENENNSVEIARFAIENPVNDEEFEYNEQLEGSMEDICQKLRSLLGNYKIPQDEEKKELRASIAKVYLSCNSS